METLVHPTDGATMVLIPAGPFLMGLPEKDIFAENDEIPQRQVHLDAFWIDVYPVTNRRFHLFLQAGGYEHPEWWHPDGWAWKCRRRIKQPLQWQRPGWDGPDQPVAGVSWYEADAYARWAGRRLPTDAEWEKAARGTDGRRYPWGDHWPTPDLANFDNVIGRTTPVGLYPAGASPYGCLDMAGNVNNWTDDWYFFFFGRLCHMGKVANPHLDDDYRRQHDDPDEPRFIEKVDRGGGFATPRIQQEVLSCTRRLHWRPKTRKPWNGFRTAMNGPDVPAADR